MMYRENLFSMSFQFCFRKQPFYPLNICLPYKGRGLQLSIFCRTAIKCEKDKLKHTMIIMKKPRRLLSTKKIKEYLSPEFDILFGDYE